MKKSIQVIEHTPIYDLAEFEQRQKKRKLNLFLKNLGQTVSFVILAKLLDSGSL